MIDFDLYEYYRNNKDNNIILSFKGAVSQEILVEIGSMIRNKFTMQKDIKKNIFCFCGVISEYNALFRRKRV